MLIGYPQMCSTKPTERLEEQQGYVVCPVKSITPYIAQNNLTKLKHDQGSKDKAEK